MSNYVNLLDIIYPVNSVYITTSSVSPATSIGGTWTQIEGGACIAAFSDNNSLGDYTGSHTISADNMPPHQHSLARWTYTDNGNWYNGPDNVPASCQANNKWTCMRIDESIPTTHSGGGKSINHILLSVEYISELPSIGGAAA